MGSAIRLMLVAAFDVTAASAQTISTAQGPVGGTPGADAGFMVYRGIPYAAAPVGSLRWMPPKAPVHHAEVLKADHFAPDCWSVRPSPESTAGGQSEDCLYLNIWTPARAPKKLPVMLWIYGGAFMGGSPSYPRFDGTGLNRKGVIVVTFGYRTGVLGFLAHPALAAESPHYASGNYGVLDAIAALRWVRANIAPFGGDPANITVFGQSSGSQTVNLLTVSPLARGLFAKAIGESGAGFGEREPFEKAAAEATGASYAAAFGGSLAAMRAATPQQLVAAVNGRKFEPMVDGWFLPANPHTLYAQGQASDLPTLVGANADEGQLSPTLTRDAYVEQIRQRYGAHADEVLAMFPAADDNQARASAKAQGTLVLGDFNVGSWADGQAGHGRAPVWQYRFQHAPPPSPTPPASKGAYHGAEIPYAFNNLDKVDRAWTDADRVLAATLSSYWANFARTGDPNGPGLPRWDRLDPASPRVLSIGDTMAMAPRADAEARAKVENIFYGPGGIYAPAVTKGRAR